MKDDKVKDLKKAITYLNRGNKGFGSSGTK